ncbi:hypothetical protein AS160_05170 [Marinitoga sp. 38H-ov]|nr:hypothetical protein AS160_05170 [Marinitoga sp. 38H-ov]
MNPNVILDLKNHIKGNDILISFIGPFSQGIIEEIGNALREHLKKDENMDFSANSVFSVFIEQSQNIKNYEKVLSDVEKNISDSIILIGKDNNNYFICSGNTIKKEHMLELKNKLEKINSLNKNEIKKIYKEKLKNHIYNENGSAGLGLLEMAKRSCDKFKYDFIKLNEKYYYFVLIVKV